MLLDWYKTGTRLIQDWDKTSGTTKLYLDNSVSGGKDNGNFFNVKWLKDTAIAVTRKTQYEDEPRTFTTVGNDDIVL